MTRGLSNASNPRLLRLVGRWAPYATWGTAFITLLLTSLSWEPLARWLIPVHLLVVAHAYVLDAVLTAGGIAGGPIEAWLGAAYVGFAVPLVVLAETRDRFRSPRRWRKALVVWVVAIGLLSLLIALLAAAGIGAV